MNFTAMSFAWIDFAALLFAVDILLVTGGIFYLLYHPREPRAMLAWLMAFLLLPIIGVILFYLLSDPSLNRRRRRLAKYRRRLNPGLWEKLRAANEAYAPEKNLAANSPQQAMFINLATRVGERQPPVAGNSVRVYHDRGNEMLNRLLAVIEAAQHHIHMEYFTFRADRSGGIIADALKKKARQGVQCRLLLDYLGSWGWPEAFLSELTDAGVEVVFFMPLVPWRGKRWRLRFNSRNHRKIAIFDGCRGFTGSQNIGDEYFDRGENFERWIDTHLELQGAVVYQLQESFIEDWHIACGEDLFADEYFPLVSPSDDDQIVQIIASGPDYDAQIMHHLLLAAISAADQSICIASPYFVPDNAMILTLEAAAYRGVQVKLLLPAALDHRIALWAGRSYYSELLSAGIEVFEFTQGFLHSKLVIIDNSWGLIGSANMDERSFRLNFEVTAVLYNADPVKQLQSDFEAMLKTSRKITDYDLPANALHKLRLGAARLLSPMY